MRRVLPVLTVFIALLAFPRVLKVASVLKVGIGPVASGGSTEASRTTLVTPNEFSIDAAGGSYVYRGL